ncbi:hypothetical protein J2W22_002863 [Sphingomonas kyeonggiensis]|uniref:hypothetical protein n=1 Tax=Sphingomonas kyeonggiensis TaxID=1268553 RepID=UPI0027871345|nr:hypothetical protein [Sphingomonas kyeonggiensis]MDQ0250799.1 hypothetical protein [Sphingomonas kyeonggiensis]
MPRLAEPMPPVPDTQLARSIASWLRRVPPRTLVELADSDARDDAAAALGEMIAAEMTMAYPELVESSAPALPF